MRLTSKLEGTVFLEELEKKEIVIYGTGYIAHQFYNALCKYNLEKKVLCFAKTEIVEVGMLEGKTVLSFRDIPIRENTLICLAVHEAVLYEIEKNIQQRTDQYVWIYPYLHEMMFGKPERRNVEISVAKILGGFRRDFRLGVRLAAIEEWDGKNKYGFNYYIRAQRLHCTEETAEKRLQQFIELIKKWKVTGYKKEHTISLNYANDVFDGCHRLAIAVYVGQKEIYGDIYHIDLSAKDIHGDKVMLFKEILLKNGFAEWEIQRLEKLQQEYMDRY